MDTALFVTFGYRTEGILGPMRKLGFKKIVVVTGKENLKKPGYLKIKGYLPPHEVLEVDVFDFWDCYSKIQDKIENYKSHGFDTKVAASGGTHLLFSAAILAAWAAGAKCHFIDNDIHGEIPQLPIKAINLILEKNDGKVLKNIPDKGISYLKVDTLGPFPEKEIQEALDRLEKAESVELHKGTKPTVKLTESGRVARRFL